MPSNDQAFNAGKTSCWNYHISVRYASVRYNRSIKDEKLCCVDVRMANASSPLSKSPSDGWPEYSPLSERFVQSILIFALPCLDSRSLFLVFKSVSEDGCSSLKGCFVRPILQGVFEAASNRLRHRSFLLAFLLFSFFPSDWAPVLSEFSLENISSNHHFDLLIIVTKDWGTEVFKVIGDFVFLIS